MMLALDTLLFNAVCTDDVESVINLLEQEANYNAEAKGAHTDLIPKLTQGQWPHNIENSLSPLMLAIMLKHEDCVFEIAKKKALSKEPVNFMSAERQILSTQVRFESFWGCLHAFEEGYLELLAPPERMLLKAARHDDCGAIREALSRGANPNTLDHMGRTAFMIAAYFGKIKALQTLFDAGLVEPTLSETHQGYPDALSAALATDYCKSAADTSIEVIQFLAPRSDCNRYQAMSGNHLSKACESGHQAIFEVLLPYANVNQLAGYLKAPAIVYLASYEGLLEEKQEMLKQLWPLTDLNQALGSGQIVKEILLGSSLGSWIKQWRAECERDAINAVIKNTRHLKSPPRI